MKKLIVTLAVCLFAFAAFELRAQTQPVPTLTSAQYASMKKDDVYVIMFSQRGCGPCVQAKKTLLPALIQAYASEDNVHVYLFPVETDSPADGVHLYNRLGISGAPSFVVLYNDTPVFSHTGFSAETQDVLKKQISSAVSKVK